MKVLIISQPVLSKTNNMGKTLMGLCVLHILVDVYYLTILLIEMPIEVDAHKYVDGKATYMIKI